MINKTKLVLGVATALTLTGALVSTDAMAHAKKAKHHHKMHTVTESSSSYSSSTTHPGNSKMDAMEAQMQAMQAEIMSLRAQQNRPVASAEAAKVQELDEWMASSKAKPHHDKHGDNMLYFRGGYALNDSKMGNTTNDLGNMGIPGSTKSSRDGWDFGAGIDFSLSQDMFGLMKGTELLGELDLNYSDFGKFTGNLGAGTTVAAATHSATGVQSQYRITAAPKIKFLKGSSIRPWIIPVGFTLNVMSPPSQANVITELKPAMHFGGGVDYNIWKSVYVGTDVRYNLAFDSLSGTNTNGFQAGGTLGFGF